MTPPMRSPATPVRIIAHGIAISIALSDFRQ
jgi:hypothetical protein